MSKFEYVKVEFVNEWMGNKPSTKMTILKQKAIELGVSVKGGATATVEAFKLIGSAKPELLANKEALSQVTEQAILLAQASGLELPDAATRLTDAMNQFGAGSEQAGLFVDTLCL